MGYGAQNENKLSEAARAAASRVRQKAGLRPAPKPAVTPILPAKSRAKRAPSIRNRPEHDIQVEYMDWVRAQKHPDYRLIYAVPNGAAMKSREAADMVAEGLTAGVEDLSIDVARGGFFGAKIEVKAKGGETAATQREWHLRHRRAGYYVEVTIGLDALKAATLWYLSQPPTLVARSSKEL